MTVLVSCNIIDTAERSSMMLLGTSLVYWKQCLSRMWSQWTPLSVGPLSIQPLFLLIHTVSWWRWEGGGVGWAWCLAEMAAERRGSHGSGVSERFGGAVTLTVVTCIQCMTSQIWSCPIKPHDLPYSHPGYNLADSDRLDQLVLVAFSN